MSGDQAPLQGLDDRVEALVRSAPDVAARLVPAPASTVDLTLADRLASVEADLHALGEQVASLRSALERLEADRERAPADTVGRGMLRGRHRRP